MRSFWRVGLIAHMRIARLDFRKCNHQTNICAPSENVKTVMTAAASHARRNGFAPDKTKINWPGPVSLQVYRNRKFIQTTKHETLN
jgi:hypothetical protein